MDNLSPIDTLLSIPTKEYVDSKAATVGFKAYSGRWGPAWPSQKAALIFSVPSYWIYAYRITSQVNIQAVGTETAVALAGGTFRIGLYSDANPWPGVLENSVGFTADAKGMKYSGMAIGPGTFWLALHNQSASALSMRAVIGPNPYTPGSIDTTPASAMSSGIGYNVGSATIPPTWPVGTGTDATGLELLLRAT